MAQFLSKPQLGLAGVPQYQVSSLGQDLIGLFGATAKGVETYNTIGENAAKLDFRDISYEVTSNLTKLEEQSSMLAPDDVDGHAKILELVNKQKDIYTQNLSKYTDHKAAFDVFANSSAEASMKIDDIAVDYNKKLFTASIAYNANLVTIDGQRGLKADNSSFDASKLSMSQLGEEKSLEFTRNEYFNPLFAQANNNAVSRTPQEEAYEIIGANGVADINRVLSYMNNKILLNSEMAKMKIVKDENGVEYFAVDSKFSEEQNSKLISMANTYMQMHTKKEKADTYPVWAATNSTIDSTTATIDSAQSIEEVNAITAQIDKQFEQYEKHPEHSTIVDGSSQFSSIHITKAKSMTAANKRKAVLNAMHNGHTVAENSTSALSYTVVNAATLMYPENSNMVNSVGKISNSELSAAYKIIDSNSASQFTSGNTALAFSLSQKYKSMTGESTSSLDKIMQLAETQGVAPATTISQISAYKNITQKRRDIGIITSNQYVSAMRMYDVAISSAGSDGVITPKVHAAMASSMADKTSYHWDDSPDNKKIRAEVESSPWLSNAKVNSSTLSETQQMLLVKGKMKQGDSPEAQGKLIADNLAYGINKTLLPRLDGIEDNQLKYGMEASIKAYAKQHKINISTSSDNIVVSLDGTKSNYVVRYKESNGAWSSRSILMSTKNIIGHYDAYKKSGGKIVSSYPNRITTVQGKSNNTISGSGRRR